MNKGQWITLKKLSDNQGNLRTNEMSGYLISNVEVGKPINVAGEPLDKKADLRLVTTSEVTAIERVDLNAYEVKTLNSIYLVTFPHGDHN